MNKILVVDGYPWKWNQKIKVKCLIPELKRGDNMAQTNNKLMYIENRYIVKTGRVVIIWSDGYDEELGEEVRDICTGELFGFRPENGGYIVPHCPHAGPWWDDNGRHWNKKEARKRRIFAFTGTHWKPGSEKKIGKKRSLRRRMWPNAAEWAEYENFLPF